MKQITKLNRIMTKANPEFDVSYFDSYEFMHKSKGMNEALLWLWYDEAKRCDTLGEACNLERFCEKVGSLIGEYSGEVRRYLLGTYRDIFLVLINFGQNHIEPKDF